MLVDVIQKLKVKTYDLLRWSERYTKTDMVYLTKGGFWIIGGQGLNTILALILSIGFANLLPQETYGTYRFILSGAAIIGIFALTGIDVAVTQAVARGYEGMLRYGFNTYARWSWLMFTAAGLLGTYYFINGNQVLGTSFLIVGTFSPFIAGASLYGEFLNGKKAFKQIATCNAIQTTLSTAALFGVMLVTDNVVPLVFTYFLAQFIGSMSLYAWVNHLYKPNQNVDESSISFGKHVTLTNVLGVISDQLDKILVFHLLGAAQLALYSFAIAIPEYLRSSTKIFSTLATPKYAERTLDSFQHSLKRKILLLSLGLAGVVIVYVLTAPYVFQVIYPNYLEAVTYSQVYALVVLAGAVTLPSAVINSQRALKEQYILSLSDNLFRIVSLIVLAYSFGLWGIIAARLMGRAFTLILGSSLVLRMK